MDGSRFVHRIIRPALALMADVLGDKRMQSHEAQLLLTAIALQESACTYRWQIGGPARGYWQFERKGGLAGVLAHSATGHHLEALCSEIDLTCELDALWQALPYSELLQVACARLLLWSDPHPLPADGSADLAWETYLRLWRPGKPRRAHWPGYYGRAQDLCAGGW